MKFLVEYPISSRTGNGEWLRPQNIVRFAQVAEAAGIDAISLTEHPAPTRKSLEGGGHETFDPFVGLAFLAAATQRIQLMTSLTVVPWGQGWQPRQGSPVMARTSRTRPSESRRRTDQRQWVGRRRHRPSWEKS